MLHGKIGMDAFLGRDVDLYFHDHYYGFSSSANTLKYINYLKNDRRNYDAVIPQCEDIRIRNSRRYWLHKDFLNIIEIPLI